MNDGPTPLGSLLLLLIVIAVIWAITRALQNRQSRRKEANAPAELDRRFDGSARVRYTVEPSSLTYGTVIDGAQERGYHLVDKDDRKKSAVVLTFDRAETPGRD